MHVSRVIFYKWDTLEALPLYSPPFPLVQCVCVCVCVYACACTGEGGSGNPLGRGQCGSKGSMYVSRVIFYNLDTLEALPLYSPPFPLVQWVCICVCVHTCACVGLEGRGNPLGRSQRGSTGRMHVSRAIFYNWDTLEALPLYSPPFPLVQCVSVCVYACACVGVGVGGRGISFGRGQWGSTGTRG
jgi:hypothetical protein